MTTTDTLELFAEFILSDRIESAVNDDDLYRFRRVMLDVHPVCYLVVGDTVYPGFMSFMHYKKYFIHAYDLMRYIKVAAKSSDGHWRTSTVRVKQYDKCSCLIVIPKTMHMAIL